jgi:DNA helicase-2/ATP-dependent DNA helicase PcrA
LNKYDMLNPEQKEAVFYTEGPLLILAGAGSGKTRVLTHRAAYLIEEKGVNPYHILAITFTNKAAGEMRERIDDMVGFGAESIWVSTFHSCCVRILRRYIDRIGYENNFSIYDADDQKHVMKEIVKRLNINTKMYKERAFLNAISSAKDELIGPEEYKSRTGGDLPKEQTARVYREYQEVLRKNNALDFDDLIFKCVELLQKDPQVLESYQERFQYIMVDEYQDTNTAQFQLIRLLAGKYRNLCVVGDDDQSIYRFRGANIQNILSFEEQYPDAKVIKLEQNYRSTQNILDAANAVIKNNRGRKDKDLWTEEQGGEKVHFQQFETAYEEADFIAGDVARLERKGIFDYGESAVLYRTNAQSRLLEEKFVSRNIPYRIIGGVNFYSRKEIKDILAYLKTIDNGSDDLAVKRIINIPKRGIGATSINRVQTYADEQGISFFEACRMTEQIPKIGKAAGKIQGFVNLIRVLRAEIPELGIQRVTEKLLEETGYVEDLKAEHDEEADARIENIDELISKIADYEDTAEEPTLGEFLDEVSLVADIDSLEDDKNYVTLMTLHSAKGLEFPNVYMAGMEDGLFPSYMTITADDPTELEEERRLCYVGITRAKKRLTMTAARTRMQRGEMQYNRTSRFLKEVPEELLEGQLVKQKERPIYQQANTGYAAARKALHGKDSYAAMRPQKNFGKAAEIPKPAYQVGDRVRHKKFGDGTVTAMTAGGRDYEVTVDFDTAGTKKMFALFAKMVKL